MTTHTIRARTAGPSGVPAGPSQPRTPIVPNGVLGMLIFVIVEAMMFAGLISAFVIVQAAAVGSWPPPGQPRLPAGETAINTVALLLSGVALLFAQRSFRSEPARALRPLLVSILLGAFFVLFQGAEWVALIGRGLTLTSSTHGSFFYLIVGMHGLHAVAALGLLAFIAWRLQQGRLTQDLLSAGQVFWYFVVGLWPILYIQVYL